MGIASRGTSLKPFMSRVVTNRDRAQPRGSAAGPLGCDDREPILAERLVATGKISNKIDATSEDKRLIK